MCGLNPAQFVAAPLVAGGAAQAKLSYYSCTFMLLHILHYMC